MKFVNLTPYWPLFLGLLIGSGLGALLGYFGQCTSGTCPLTSTWWRGALYGGFLGLFFAISSTWGRENPARPSKAERALERNVADGDASRSRPRAEKAESDFVNP